MKRRSAFLDSQRVIGGGFTAHERDLRKAVRTLAQLVAMADTSAAGECLQQALRIKERLLAPKLEPKRK